MKRIVPDYYLEFQCIAGACKHSCCQGWEIDIDADSFERYQGCPGEIGRRIRENVALNPEGEEAPAHFVLRGEEERCPFLNGENLCDLILTMGEDSLCQICRDHPRFRNYWTDREEIGLGMACEEAARLILSWREKVNLVMLKDDIPEAEVPDIESGAGWEGPGGPNEETNEEYDFEEDLRNLRDDLFEILQDRTLPVDQRILKMLQECSIPEADYVPDFADGPIDEIACEQLAVYLIYRHLADALYDDRLEERVLFAARSYMRVRNAWAESGKTDMDSLVEVARAFSEDVEYDTDTWG